MSSEQSEGVGAPGTPSDRNSLLGEVRHAAKTRRPSLYRVTLDGTLGRFGEGCTDGD
jgi:hypothetical protein